MQRRTTRLLVTAMLVATTGVGVAGAAEQTILGATIQVKDPGSATKRTLAGSAKEPGSLNAIVGDPTVAGGLLEVAVNGGTSTSQAFTLPQGVGSSGKPFWSAVGTTGYQYRDSKGQNGPVKGAKIQKTAGGNFLIKAVISGKNGALNVVPPNPGTHGCMALTIVSGDRYSVEYGATSTIKNTGAKLFAAKKPAAEGSCPAVPTPTATSTPSISPTPTPTATVPNNVLLIIADDLGLDAAPCYGLGASVAPAPNIEALCNAGVVFRNAWSNPICSPTRASILTGRYSFRTGVGYAVSATSPALSVDEITIPKALDLAPGVGVAHANVGKWHLGNGSNGGPDSPNLLGWSHYSGLLIGALPSYFAWSKTVNGQSAMVTNYATTENVDDALAWIGTQQEPWLLWLAFNAPHPPFHLPPTDLHSYDGLSGTAQDISNNPLPYFQAMIEAMDTEIGRLLSSLDPAVLARTNVVFVGDNGSPGSVVQAPYSSGRAKDTLYQGGIHVPLVIAGPVVSDGGRSVEALVNTVDLFSTTLEMLGVDVPATIPSTVTLDSVSLLPYLATTNSGALRPWVFAEEFGAEADPDQTGKAIRDSRYKLIRFDNGSEDLYDLELDPYEQTDLLNAALSPEAQIAYDSLSASLDGLS